VRRDDRSAGWARIRARCVVRARRAAHEELPKDADSAMKLKAIGGCLSQILVPSMYDIEEGEEAERTEEIEGAEETERTEEIECGSGEAVEPVGEPRSSDGKPDGA
jgi:hypothetical protein